MESKKLKLYMDIMNLLALVEQKMKEFAEFDKNSPQDKNSSDYEEVN